MASRATKIVATLGPASSDPALLEQMIRAGVNVVRLNFSHGKAQDHIDRARLVREAAQRAGREVAIMADLQGPKIRVGKFENGKIELVPGAPFILDADRTELGNQEVAGLDYKDAPEKAGPFLTDLGNPFAAIGADSSGRAAIDWGVYGVPETFLIDRRGVIVWKQVGPFTPETIERELTSAGGR